MIRYLANVVLAISLLVAMLFIVYAAFDKFGPEFTVVLAVAMILVGAYYIPALLDAKTVFGDGDDKRRV